MNRFKQIVESCILEKLSNPEGLKNFRNSVKDINKVDTRDLTWMSTLKTIMAKYNFIRLGAGKYGSVFGNDSYPYVIKVFMKDSAYLKWIDFCLKNQNNKWVPKIKGKVIKITDMFYAIRLEKLNPSDGDDKLDRDIIKLKHAPNFVPEDKDLADIFSYFKDYMKLLDLHNENIMNRGKQTVIIDPFYNYYDSSKNKYTIDPDDIDSSVFRSIFSK